MEIYVEKSVLKPNNIIGQIIAIFFIEASSAAAFAVFFSGLSLYLTQQGAYSNENAAVITGLFLSLNYFLQLIGGMVANRIISYKKLYCLGSLISAGGCLLLAYGINLKIGLSLCLMSSLVTTVCLNMFITKLFQEDQVTERRIAFIWNYVGMNLGFLIGYFLTGYFTILNNYFYLFVLMSLLTIISIFLTLIFIQSNGFLEIKKSALYQISLTSLVMLGLVIFISKLFDYSTLAQNYMTLLSLVLLGGLIYYGSRKTGLNKNKFLKFTLYSSIAIVFWTIYMLTPIAFMQIIEHDVQRTIFGINIAPQWFVNIDSIVILCIAPQLAFLLKRRNECNQKPLETLGYFTLAFLFTSVAFSILLLNLFASLDHGKLPMWGMFCYLILLTLGEIFISPIGNSLIGELIPESMRGVMTGAWSMNIGIGGLLASVIAKRFILLHVDKNGLVGPNLVEFQHIIIIISLMLAFLTASMYLYRRNCKM